MTTKYSIAQARDHLTRLVRQAERGTPIELTRRGKPVAILLSTDQYRRLADNRPDFWTAWLSFRARYSDDEFGIDPEAFEGLRDPSPGREVEL